ncbi:MAG: thiamine pyrophosphate-dependent dehydrogenase E1 component subunit alpha [Actinomycetota bacterium]
MNKNILEIEQKLSFYEKMLKIRFTEETAINLYSRNIIKGSMHTYIGEEAVAVGICSALDVRKGDAITSTHRGHGHFIAMGGEVKYMLSELLGKANGYCKGKGGSMHIADKDIGVYGANGIVAGGIAIACGLALANSLTNSDCVAVTFFGDGAANQGILYESMNMSSNWKLPVIFVCENNMYAQTTPARETLSGGSVSKRAEGFGIEGIDVDGNDVEKVYEIAKYAVDKARSKKLPTLIEAKTYRWKGHWVGDPEMYRTKEEVKEWILKCPIKNYEKKLIDIYGIEAKTLEMIKSKIALEVSSAEEFAISSKEPDIETLFDGIYTEGEIGIK